MIYYVVIGLAIAGLTAFSLTAKSAPTLTIEDLLDDDDESLFI
jgi:hypothetical protein